MPPLGVSDMKYKKERLFLPSGCKQIFGAAVPERSRSTIEKEGFLTMCLRQKTLLDDLCLFSFFFFFKVDKVFQRESPAVKTSSTAACLKSLQLQFEKAD